MKKLLIAVTILVSGCATVQTKDKCTLTHYVDNQSCYDTCLAYTLLSEKSTTDGQNATFFRCLEEVCKGGFVCLQNIERKGL